MRSTSYRAALAGLVGLAAFFPSLANADTQGTIGVALNVTNACVINGASAVQTNSGQIGQITFPDQPGLFGDIDGEVVAAGGTGALSVLCSPGATPAVTIGSGNNDAAGRRRMAYNGNAVSYRLFTDSARTSEITIGQRIALPVATSTATLVPIYARVNSGGVVLPAGAYTDTVRVTLTF